MLPSSSSNSFAMIVLAAFVGWWASQNSTYLDRSSHKIDCELSLAALKQTNGGKCPPQHGSFAFSNPGTLAPMWHLETSIIGRKNKFYLQEIKISETILKII